MQPVFADHGSHNLYDDRDATSLRATGGACLRGHERLYFSRWSQLDESSVARWTVSVARRQSDGSLVRPHGCGLPRWLATRTQTLPPGGVSAPITICPVTFSADGRMAHV